jgi:hypothetical protein
VQSPESLDVLLWKPWRMRAAGRVISLLAAYYASNALTSPAKALVTVAATTAEGAVVDPSTHCKVHIVILADADNCP